MGGPVVMDGSESQTIFCQYSNQRDRAGVSGSARRCGLYHSFPKAGLGCSKGGLLPIDGSLCPSCGHYDGIRVEALADSRHKERPQLSYVQHIGLAVLFDVLFPC